ncbi:MAG: type II toxin-antitoxin system HicB family antitoxin, partial [Bacillota bacterium]|nr:type II toxin-antitoxin system HicB family antitoxin [Bacillota bacterium]
RHMSPVTVLFGQRSTLTFNKEMRIKEIDSAFLLYEYHVFRHGGDFVCSFPDLPGCSGAGDTLGKAIQDGKAAQASWLEDDLNENGGNPLPIRGNRRTFS